MEFELNLDQDAIDALGKTDEMKAVLLAAGSELADRIRDLIPTLTDVERAGWSAGEPGEIDESITVGFDEDDNVAVYSDDFRIIFYELGTARVDGSQTTAYAPFRRALDSWAAENDYTVDYSGATDQ
jgi:hypothetical protein